jgi:hypothetical protein
VGSPRRSTWSRPRPFASRGRRPSAPLSDGVELLHGYADVQQAQGHGDDGRRDIHPHDGLRHAPFVAGSNEYPVGLGNRISSAPFRAMPAARIDRPRARNQYREACVFRGADRRNQSQIDTNRRAGELRRPGQWVAIGTGRRRARTKSLMILPTISVAGSSTASTMNSRPSFCRFRWQSVSGRRVGLRPFSPGCVGRVVVTLLFSTVAACR